MTPNRKYMEKLRSYSTFWDEDSPREYRIFPEKYKWVPAEGESVAATEADWSSKWKPQGNEEHNNGSESG